MISYHIASRWQISSPALHILPRISTESKCRKPMSRK